MPNVGLNEEPHTVKTAQVEMQGRGNLRKPPECIQNKQGFSFFWAQILDFMTCLGLGRQDSSTTRVSTSFLMLHLYIDKEMLIY